MQSLCVRKLETATLFCLLVTLSTMTHTMNSFSHFTMPSIDKKTFLLGALVATNLLFFGVSSCVMRSLWKTNREQSKKIASLEARDATVLNEHHQKIESLEARDAKFLEESKTIAQELVVINGMIKELGTAQRQLGKNNTTRLEQLSETAKNQAMINQDQEIMNKALQEQYSIQQALEQENATVLEQLIKTAKNQATINRDQALTNQALQKQSTEHQQTLRTHRKALNKIIKHCIQPPPGTKESTNPEM
jgi:hypothetical protein